MLLAIDVGNTHSVFALCRGAEILHSWRIATNHLRTEDEYAAVLLRLAEHDKLSTSDINGAIMSSVVPDTVFPIRRCCELYFGCTPMLVGSDTPRLDIEVKIDRPAELGADRLVNAIAAREEVKAPLIVVDFGTATTFDVVDAQGDYIGGIIAPGVNLSLEALRSAAAKLHGIVIRRPEKVIGTNTTAAMQSGVYYGYLNLVNGILAEIKQEYGQPMKVVATGGLAELYARDNPSIDLVDPQLTVKGLARIYERNQTKA